MPCAMGYPLVPQIVATIASQCVSHLDRHGVDLKSKLGSPSKKEKNKASREAKIKRSGVVDSSLGTTPADSRLEEAVETLQMQMAQLLAKLNGGAPRPGTA